MDRSKLTTAFPPVAAMGVALALVVLALPSAFTIPSADPTETAEYAPVPPGADDETPPGGDLGALGLASSDGGGTGDGSGAGSPQPGGPSSGSGKSPRTKQCVRTPSGLRQTEDALSPPCVADFRGDNLGDTWQGVTGDEIRILFYVQGGRTDVNVCANPNQQTPDKRYFDLAQPAEPGEHCLLTVLRTWQRYFNDRFQTYGRFAHFFVYFSGIGHTAEERRADAAENFARVRPFAVVTKVISFEDTYLREMARRGALNFGSFLGRPESFFEEFPRQIWGYLPSVDQQAHVFAGYVCRQVAPFPTSFSRNADQNGTPRVFGLWKTADPAHPELQHLAAEVKRLVRNECGVEFAVERTFPEAGFVHSNRHPPTYAVEAVADFSSAGVTTVVWAGGLETNLTRQMARVRYLPEIVAMGDGTLEGDVSGTFQDQEGWNGARVVSSFIFQGPLQETVCFRAYRETNPTGDVSEIEGFACPFYRDILQLFTGIQVAGPRLTPATIDAGFRAIPAVVSPDVTVPACYYEAGDYTCIKDALVERWDSSAEDNSGCFRAVEAGGRHGARDWPAVDAVTLDTPDDPCNGYSGQATINPRLPDSGL